MLRDITIGQHFPGNSLVHRFDPRLKLVLTIAYIVLLFAASNPLGLTLSILFLAVMYRVAKIPGKMILKSLKPILPIVVFTAVLNLFFVSGEGDPLVKLGFLTIYTEGVRYAVLMAVRVMALIAGTSLLTYTTSPIVLTDAIEQLLKPLGRLHFPVHELAMMMSIALRFIPTLIEETDKIMNAQKARGAQLDTGKMLDRVKALLPRRRRPHPAQGAALHEAGLHRPGVLHRLLCGDPVVPVGVPEFLKEHDAPLGQRTRGAFRRAPLILWTPLTPDEKGAARPFQTPKLKSERKKLALRQSALSPDAFCVLPI